MSEIEQFYSRFSGLENNTASGGSSSVSGGASNIADGSFSSVTGGATNAAHGPYSTVSGGNTVTNSIDSGWSGGSLHNP